MRFPTFPLFVAASFLVGWYIPAFYDWTGSEQSRPSPIVNQTAIGLLLSAIVFCGVLPWLPIANDPPAVDKGGKFQFRIRTILAITAAVAAYLAIFRKTPLQAIGIGVYAIALANAAQFWFTFRPYRWRMISLLACMYFPFVWIVRFDGTFGLVSSLLQMVSGSPTLIPTFLISSLAKQHPERLTWLSSSLTGVELIVGLWTIRQGARRAIAYHLFALIMSIFGSFVLNALMRM